MDEYIGIIKIFGGNFAPRGWAFCNGSLLPISQYDAVFALLGTTFGGDGQTTFALPDLRSRTPIGTGQGPGLSSFVEGQVGGNENVTLLTQNIPTHIHALNVSNTKANVHSPVALNSIAAPVDVGTILAAPARPILKFLLDGASTIACEAVYACTVVIIALLIPTRRPKISTIGLILLVVQLAHEKISVLPSFVFTP